MWTLRGHRKETLAGGVENGPLRLYSGDVGITLAQGRIREGSGQISYSSPQLRTMNEKGNFRKPRFVSDNRLLCQGSLSAKAKLLCLICLLWYGAHRALPDWPFLSLQGLVVTIDPPVPVFRQAVAAPGSHGPML